MGTFDNLRNNAEYTVSESRIADYILHHAGEVVGLSLEDVVKILGVSKSTMIRFCRKNGYKGYRDMVAELAGELDNYLYDGVLIDAGSPYLYDDDRNALAGKTYALMKGALEDTFKGLPMAKVMSLARTMHDDGCVVYSSDELYFKAYEFVRRLAWMNVNADVVRLGERPEQRALRQKEECAGIFLSYEGNEENLLKCAKILKGRRIPVYLITGPHECLLEQYADGEIRIPYDEPQPKQVSCGSDVSYDLVLNLIYAFIFSMDYERNNQQVKKSIRA